MNLDEKRAEAVRLRTEGKTYKEIGQVFGVSISTVCLWCNPGIREHKKRYAKCPETKDYQRQYRNRPENKERMKEYLREYRNRPENKERQREYHRRRKERLAA